MLSIVLTLGVVSQGISGAKLALEGIEEGTGIPIATAFKGLRYHAMRELREGVAQLGDLAGRVLEGTGDVTTRILTNYQGPPLLASTDPAAITRSLDEADANAAEAERLAAQHEKTLADPTTDESEKQDVSTVVRTMRRYAAFTRQLSKRARAALQNGIDTDIDEVKKLVDWALSASQASKDPPKDAAPALASQMPSDVKANVAKVIDHMSRSAEPNYDDLSYVLVPVDDGADETNGPDHGDCGGPGHCDCHTCAHGNPMLEAFSSLEKKPRVEGRESAPASAADWGAAWKGLEGMRARTSFDFGAPPPACTTGCSVPRR